MKRQSVLQKISNTVSTLEQKDVSLFLQAFFTPKELESLCTRYLLIKSLMNGITQREIAKKLGISITKVTRGSTELKYGKGRIIFKKIFNNNE